MAVLLLRCAGPMQSWGTHSRFRERDTGLEPSKSGVIGLLCAALGRRREEDVEDLARLRMGVRVDREGVMMHDFHTAMNVARAGGGLKDTEISTRYFLADADFLVGLEGEDTALLEKCHSALAAPVWPLALGRKSFPPGRPVHLPDGLKHGVGVEEALRDYPLETRGPGDEGAPLRVVLEVPLGQGEETRTDQPVGASFATRKFTVRQTTTRFLERAKEVTP